MSPLLPRLLPFLHWIGSLRRDQLRPDLEAALISAILILPQSIALATLAGMPPEYGIYTSIIPVMIAALWGSSSHTLSGPNTAVCVLLAASVAPFANAGSSSYIGLVLALTLMAGVIELLVGTLRLGSLLDFISQTVISGIVLAVGLVIIISALPALLGVLSNLDQPFFIKLYQGLHDLSRANPYSLSVGVVTLLSGLLIKRYMRRYALVLAVLIGSLYCYLLNSWYGPASTGIELLGRLSFNLMPLSVPSFNMESMYILKELLLSAFAIAFLGLMQTIVIARSLAMKSGQSIDTNQEIVSQGLSNIVAPFLSGFASSGSFNRSAAHYEAGARTPLSAIYASLLLALLVLVGAPVIAYLPMPAIAGALMLVGIGLVDLQQVKLMLRARQEAVIFFVTFFTALTLGLNSGVLAGVLMSLFVYLRFASTPNVRVERQFAQDGRPVAMVIIDGNLFFGSVNYVETQLTQQLPPGDESSLLLLRTDHITYLDHPGVAMIAAEARRRQRQGNELYLYIDRDTVSELFEESGLLDTIGRDRLILAKQGHPMKALFMPYSSSPASMERSPSNQPASRALQTIIQAQQQDQLLQEGSELLEAICRWLHHSAHFTHLSPKRLRELLTLRKLQHAEAGSQLIGADDELFDYLLLLHGRVEIERHWGEQRASSRTLDAEREDGLIAPATGRRDQLVVTTLSEVHYLLLDSEALELALSQGEQLAVVGRKPVSAFRYLPAANLEEAYARLTTLEVKAGEMVIQQGDPGDAYYQIESGEAEVLRRDPFTQQIHLLAHLGEGDSFGEDALLQDIHRNASVRMLSAGRLQVLKRADFEQLIQPNLVDELGPDEAREKVQSGAARWLDCRFAMEYQSAHQPDALHLPLDLLRDQLGRLDEEQEYIVYCSNGRRSAAAVYLLRRAGLEAFSLRGGLRDWPYALQSEQEAD